MKKVLLASTALVCTAGIAAADGHAGVSISGSAEMGINDNGVDDVQFFQDLDVTFSMSGSTDNGLSFGASIDLDEVQQVSDTVSNEALDDVTEDGIAIFVSGDFGTVTMGDTDGAFDWALTEVGGGGAIADDHTSHAGYSGNAGLDGSSDGQVLRYDNTFGDFGVAVSFEQDDLGTSDTTAGGGETLGLGVKASFGDFSVGVGYQENDADDIIGMSLAANLGDINAVLNWSDQDTTGDHIALGLTYSSGNMTLHANYGDDDTAGDGFGLAANYALGGGAEVQFGYGSDDTVDRWSLGLAMSF